MVRRRDDEGGDWGEEYLDWGATTLEVLAPAVPLMAHGPEAALGLGAFAFVSGVARSVSVRNIRRRMDAMAEVIQSLPEARYAEFMRRVSSRRRAAKLMDLAVRGVFTSSIDEQAVANGRLLVKGVLEETEAEAEFALRALAELSEIEITALLALDDAQGDSENGAQTAGVYNILDGCVREPLIPSVLSTLDAKGLVAKDPPPWPGFQVLDFGHQVATALREDKDS